MGRIDYADRNGMLPFVDVDDDHGPSMFRRYFILKTALTRSEVYKSKRVLLSGYDSRPVYPGWCNWINLDFNEQKKMLFDKYITFTDEILALANKARKELCPEECLGLYLRGTDYLALKPGGHPIQPRLDDVAPVAEQIMQEENLRRIFLVTEDANIYQKCKEQFGNRVFILKEDFFLEGYQDGELIMDTIAREKSIEENNILYLVKIIMLSECHSFVGGRTNGSSVANALNGGKYKRRFVYDEGYY